MSWIERNRGHLLVVLINSTIVLIILFWLRRPPTPEVEILPSYTPLPILTPTLDSLRVYVTGAVQHPDVYELPASSIVKDALIAAGGATVDADLERINLAQTVHDEQHIHVPRVGESITQPAQENVKASSTAPASRININTATAEELASLPGIGSALAERIVAWRETHGPFADIADIKQVSGIGDTTFARIQPYITVGP